MKFSLLLLLIIDSFVAYKDDKKKCKFALGALGRGFESHEVLKDEEKRREVLDKIIKRKIETCPQTYNKQFCDSSPCIRGVVACLEAQKTSDQYMDVDKCCAGCDE
ncbi:unnamed protein product [Bursaphelenchus xylophilus]|uniref:(pine wood nematode) hypothetical protein n=1 Tax=Bursaphelenchus xylophilus TaxID=6326 RepID=A0A1I7RYV7_BURXY|nr:unnamed protein product [Bursaphelenchus xylophilus]CAG9092158.1 unnamed protein product [Bursaphelenchus xylophilus]